MNLYDNTFKKASAAMEKNFKKQTNMHDSN